MKVPPLSQAILLGIGAVKNLRGTWIDRSNGCLEGCLVTTALYSIGQLDEVSKGSFALQMFWPWTGHPSSAFSGSVLPNGPMPVSMELSFRHCNGESRESIAAWIASIEPKEIAVPAPVPVAGEEEHVSTGA